MIVMNENGFLCLTDFVQVGRNAPRAHHATAAVKLQ